MECLANAIGRIKCRKTATRTPLVTGTHEMPAGEGTVKCRVGWGGPVCGDHLAELSKPGFAEIITEHIVDGWSAPPAKVGISYTLEWVPCDRDGKPLSHSCADPQCPNAGRFRAVLLDRNGDQAGMIVGAFCPEHRDDTVAEEFTAGGSFRWIEMVL